MKTLIAGLIAGVSVALAPSAMAQESSSESGSLAGFAEQYTERFQLEDGLVPALEFLGQQDVNSSLSSETSSERVETAELQPVSPAQDVGTASSLPWYERFTVAPMTSLQSAWGSEVTQFQFSAGERWGFSFGLSESQRGPQFQLNDVTAGAFYDLTDRFRLGTNLRFSSPEEDVFGQPTDDQVPELKFESAFRF